MYQLVMFLSILEMVWNFPNYSLEIPNGFSVPDPCSGGERTFAAVGHWQRAPHLVSFSFDGSNFNSFERNPFGFDYETKKEWKTLCFLDSDGDGFTNGEELGDPDCVWVKGERPKGPAISHPGIKEEFRNNKTTISRSVRQKVNCNVIGLVAFA